MNLRLDFKPMSFPSGEAYAELLNHPLVVRHMPLHAGPMDPEACRVWARHKESQWKTDADLGPWSIFLNGEFAGWGGLQPEMDGEAGIALVLHPRHWGLGLEICREMVRRFRENGGDLPIAILLAPSRKPHAMMQRLGCRYAGDVVEDGQVFHKFMAP